MVGACQQNSVIFLVRGGGAGDPRWLAAERDGSGQMLGRGRRRGGRGWARSGQGPDEMPAGAEAGLAVEPPETGVGGSQINLKENAL